MKDYREIDQFRCTSGVFTKIRQTTNAIAWKVEEPEGTVAYEVWTFPYGWAKAPRKDEFGKVAFYSRSEKDVSFWLNFVAKR